MISSESDQYFMQHALELAFSRRGFCAPNPAVGAIIVKNNQIVSQGAHWGCGYPHAESVALEFLDSSAKEATLYVTLEPCSHFGLTPPCTDLIIRKGIREVIYGQSDPNPDVSGGGAEILRQAGILCRKLATPEMEVFYQSYFYWLKTKLPWVSIKLAMSLDAKIADAQGKPIKITGKECQDYTHQQRLCSDGILTTIATIIADDPQLNVRINKKIIAKPVYILDSQLRLPLNSQILQTAQSVTVFHEKSALIQKKLELEKLKVNFVPVDSDAHGLNLPQVLAYIGKQGCHDLWVEAGGLCFQNFLSQHLVQTVLIYLAPKILGANGIDAFSPDFNWQFKDQKIVWKNCGIDLILNIDL